MEGLAGNLGPMELSSASRALTKACRSGEEANIAGLVQTLSRVSQRTVERLEAVVALTGRFRGVSDPG